jgi:predicted nucleic acid-binding protein
MLVKPWQPGHSFQSPVYLDANVLVGYVASGHYLFGSCGTIIGELLSTGAPILVSMITLQEAWWGMFKHSYCTINSQQSRAQFSRSTYRRWKADAFHYHSHWIEGVAQAIHDWQEAGHPVDVIPDSKTFAPAMTSAAIRYMRDLDFTPDDALHLALAEAHAGTFVTADSDFKRAEGASPSKLEILHLTGKGT